MDDAVTSESLEALFSAHYPNCLRRYPHRYRLGNQLPQVVAANLGQAGASGKPKSAMEIKGTEGYVVYAKCCCPTRRPH